MPELCEHDSLRVDQSKLLGLGSRLWPLTYGAGMTDDEVLHHCHSVVQNARDPGGAVTPWSGNTDDVSSDFQSLFRSLCFAAKWADSAYPKIVVRGHRYAAALMCTSANREADVHLPWPAFVIEVPNGLLKTSSDEFVRIHVWQMGRNANMELIPASGLEMSMVRRDMSELLLNDDWGDDLPAEEDRVCRLAQRLVVGALYAIHHTTDFKDRDRALNSGSLRGGPPKHRIVVVGRPIDLDTRPAVSEYIAGRRSVAPSVQTLVRGHYKRQVVGVARSGRKVIWVEPYWRGPETAPIMVRPHLVGTKVSGPRGPSPRACLSKTPAAKQED